MVFIHLEVLTALKSALPQTQLIIHNCSAMTLPLQSSSRFTVPTVKMMKSYTLALKQTVKGLHISTLQTLIYSTFSPFANLPYFSISCINFHLCSFHRTPSSLPATWFYVIPPVSSHLAFHFSSPPAIKQTLPTVMETFRDTLYCLLLSMVSQIYKSYLYIL